MNEARWMHIELASTSWKEFKEKTWQPHANRAVHSLLPTTTIFAHNLTCTLPHNKRMASGASAADVRSILSFAGAGTSVSSTTNGANSQPTASSSKLPLSQPLSATSSLQNVTTIAGNVTATRKAKPDGISRELYALIGSGIPTMNARLAAKPKFKQKPKLADGRVSRWYVHCAFSGVMWMLTFVV